MPVSRIIPPAALIALLAAGCAPVERDRDADPAVGIRAVRVVGEGQNCIQRAQIRQTLVRSDQVIDFEMRGGRVYRSTLDSPCPTLGIERAFTFQTSIDQLCTQDIIYVLQRLGGVPQRGPACGLGPFVPVEYVGKAGDVQEPAREAD